MSEVTIVSFVPEAVKAVGEGSYKGMLKTAIKVVSQAKAFAPVALGQLKGSLMWKSQSGSGGRTDGQSLPDIPEPDEIIVGTAVEHGIYQEKGTRYMNAQPFLTPAVSVVTSGTKAEQAMKDAMYDTVRVKLERISGAFV